MTNIDRAIKIINTRLPKKHLPKFRRYKTVYSMLRSTAREHYNSYQECIDSYEEYFKNPKTNTYLKDSKYFTKPNKPKKHRKASFSIIALGGNIVDIAEDNMNIYDYDGILIRLLHEVGHCYYRRKLKSPIKFEERKCDLFAIRWYNRIIK